MNAFDLNDDFSDYEMLPCYVALKERVLRSIKTAKTPSDLIRMTKTLLYIEHRAMRELGVIV